LESIVFNDSTDDVDTNDKPLRDRAGATLLGLLPILHKFVSNVQVKLLVKSSFCRWIVNTSY